MRKLKSLDVFQEEKWREHRERQDLHAPRPNGIACPMCGKELWDTRPMITLTSDPCQKDIHCPKCHYKGYRLA